VQIIRKPGAARHAPRSRHGRLFLLWPCQAAITAAHALPRFHHAPWKCPSCGGQLARLGCRVHPYADGTCKMHWAAIGGGRKDGRALLHSVHWHSFGLPRTGLIHPCRESTSLLTYREYFSPLLLNVIWPHFLLFPRVLSCELFFSLCPISLPAIQAGSIKCPHNPTKSNCNVFAACHVATPNTRWRRYPPQNQPGFLPACSVSIARSSVTGHFPARTASRQVRSSPAYPGYFSFP
jgi:hypothetical protein